MQQQITAAIQRALTPGRFFTAADVRLRIVHSPSEQAAWELFRGHLLDESRTRQRREFAAWDVLVDLPEFDEDCRLISVKLDAAENRLFVTRNVLVYGWESYEPSPGVVATRSTQRWIPELVGTIDLDQTTTPLWRLENALSRCLFLATVGTSRLPITSLESPLPAFMLGQFAYLPSLPQRQDPPSEEPHTQPAILIDLALDQTLPLIERAKSLETALRAAAPTSVGRLSDKLAMAGNGDVQAQTIGRRGLQELFRTLFNHVALSPYTNFVSNLDSMLRRLADHAAFGPACMADVCGYWLRHLVRHLTAFDLVTFHNNGANYPDALTLDSLLKTFLWLAEREPQAFEISDDDAPRQLRRKRLRLRALRQACLVRKQYDGHPVPDAPTSPGENLRVLPGRFARVPHQQIVDPTQRRRRLFPDEPLESLLTPSTRQLLDCSLGELRREAELQELGLAVFLDRPLGIFKEPGDVDRTPLLSYEAFSRTITAERLIALTSYGLITHGRLEELQGCLAQLPINGFPVSELGEASRPGVVALEDARKAAADFVFLRTTLSSLRALWDDYHLDTVTELNAIADLLLIRTAGFPPEQTAEPLLTAFDAHMQRRWTLRIKRAGDGSIRYREFAGREYVCNGLEVFEIDDGHERSLGLAAPRFSVGGDPFL